MATLSPILQIAKEILQDAGQKGLHVKEFAEIAVKQNKNMGLCAEDFQKKIQSALDSVVTRLSTATKYGIDFS